LRVRWFTVDFRENSARARSVKNAFPPYTSDNNENVNRLHVPNNRIRLTYMTTRRDGRTYTHARVCLKRPVPSNNIVPADQFVTETGGRFYYARTPPVPIRAQTTITQLPRYR